MKLDREKLPKRISINGTSIPVIYQGELRMIVDVHYNDDNLVYLKNNKGKPVSISDLEIKDEWVYLIDLYKQIEESMCAEELGIKELHWKKHNKILLNIDKEERKL